MNRNKLNSSKTLFCKPLLAAGITTTLLFLFSGCLSSPSSNAEASVTPEPQSHLVTRVIDGDTLVIQFSSENSENHSVRLIGVNAPEVSKSKSGAGAGSECFGEQARDKARELLEGKRVRLARDPNVPDKDKYGRLLRYVFLEDGVLANKVLVAEGYAFYYEIEPFAYAQEFVLLEKQARANRLGLWSTECSYYER